MQEASIDKPEYFYRASAAVARMPIFYHGSLKNVVLALSGKMDNHFTALWDGGHIKFWSRETLSGLLTEKGFTDLRFVGAGVCHIFGRV